MRSGRQPHEGGDPNAELWITAGNHNVVDPNNKKLLPHRAIHLRGPPAEAGEFMVAVLGPAGAGGATRLRSSHWTESVGSKRGGARAGSDPRVNIARDARRANSCTREASHTICMLHQLSKKSRGSSEARPAACRDRSADLDQQVQQGQAGSGCASAGEPRSSRSQTKLRARRDRYRAGFAQSRVRGHTVCRLSQARSSVQRGGGERIKLRGERTRQPSNLKRLRAPCRHSTVLEQV